MKQLRRSPRNGSRGFRGDNAAACPMKHRPGGTTGSPVTIGTVTRNAAFALFIALLLFLPAVTLAWPQAWIFLLIFNGCGLATGYWLIKTDPQLLAERMTLPFSADQAMQDRLMIEAIFAARPQ